MIGNPSLGRQITRRHGFHRIQRFVTEHDRDSIAIQNSEFRIPNSSELCLEQPAQLLFGAVQLRFDRAERKVQRLGQLVVLNAVEIMRRDQEPVVRRQTRNGFLQPIAHLRSR